MTVPQTTATTDPRGIIAALQQRLDAGLAREAALAKELAARDAVLTQRNSEFDERIEHQAATIDVLKAMSASPGDAQPVFDLIARQAANQCNVPTAAVATFDGKMMHLAAQSGLDAAYVAQFPRPVGLDFSMGRAVLNRRDDQVEDITADPGHSFAPVLGSWSVIAVPILRDGQSLGAITIGRPAMGPFSASQVALLQTFAEQAAIAITSAATYRALQARTSDLQETLEYQTATSDVLKVISRSTFDLQPVLDTLVETAARLCDAEQSVIYRREGELVSLVANYGFPPEYEAVTKALGKFPLDRNSPTVGQRASIEGRPVHIHDVSAVPGYWEVSLRLGKQRTSLGVPLLREGEAIGHIVLARQRVEPFTDRQIELVSTFADQAVIAMENARLITEQREALEQQTATAEVLQVINASPGDLQPVFSAMVERAATLCEADEAAVRTFDGSVLNLVATHGPADILEELTRLGPSHPDGLYEAIAQGASVTHFVDVRETEAFKTNARARERLELRGIRSWLAVALRKEGALLGVINVHRREVRPFTEKQIALLQNFAAQAVIAMENARLLTEQREALEQQTATAEVLQVINASPGDLTPVFDAILDKAHSLCGATVGNLAIYKDGSFHLVATHGFPEQVASLMLHPSAPNAYTRELIRGERFQQIEDIRAIEISPHYVILRALVEHTDVRTVLFVPLRKDGALLGFISVNRPDVRPFSEKEIALLENFAAQAVIAIENARLLNEQREALEQQTATAEVLQVINSSPGNLLPVFDAMLEKAMRLCEAAFGVLWTLDGDAYRAVALRGVTPEFAEFVVSQRRRPDPDTALGQLASGKSFVHVADVASRRTTSAMARKLEELGSIRTLLAVPLRKDQEVLGAFHIYRQEVRPFSDKQIALLQNFAAQAVIAMENARLLTETREALEQQTATAEVLQVINSNPGNLVPVFDAMLEKAHNLCGTAMGSLELYDGQHFHAVAVRGLSDTFADMLRRGTSASENPATRPLIDGARLTHIRDLAETSYVVTRSAAELDAIRTLLCVPLRREGTLLGIIASARREVRPFSEKEIALLENFAAQAVIAMENARLITEQREALEQQTAMADVLRAINALPGELAPVFDVIGERAIQLCNAAAGALMLPDGDRFRAVALGGVPEAYAEYCRDSPAYGRPNPGSLPARMLAGEDVVHIKDITDVDEYAPANTPSARALAELGGGRTLLGVALRKDSKFFGMITIFRQEVKPFSDRQIALLRSFADQAVIAMENARLLEEVRQRQEELRITFENMGDGVAMFDETQRLVAWNRKFQDILDVPDDIIARRQTFSEYVHYLAERGEYDREADWEEHVRRLIEQAGRSRTYERTRPDGRVIEIRHNPVPGGGFVLIYADITDRKRNEAEIRAARDAAEEASRAIEAAYRELKTAQANLVQAEKMASLGQLTAGIAHEIKNPLNFVNNFAALSVDLLAELKETAEPGFAALTEKQRAEVEDLSAMLTSNLEKITEHGRRADGIVKAMLEHSRGSSGERRMVDLNGLIDEALNLAYHGARAQDQSFNITLERDFGDSIDPIEINPQDMTRVFLNIFSNGFYAATRRARDGADAGFQPTLKVTTRDAGEVVEIRVQDNGTGIPADIRDKLFQPFFTTKPTGEGTGLGLSITYDIVTQQHGGSIAVDSKVGEYSEFTIRLPRNQ